jgi:hypothetical protein
MAYTKKLIGNITKGAITQRGNKRLQALADTCDENFTDIESTLSDIAVEATADLVGWMVTGNTETGITVTYQDADNTLDFAVAYGTEPGAVSSSTSGQAGTADSASRSDHNHDLGAHAHTGATDGGALTAYQADLTASSTLGDMGVATIDPAFSGALTGITTASTLAQLLAAIDSHTHS